MADFIRIENLIFDYVKHEDGSARSESDSGTLEWQAFGNEQAV